MEISVQKGAIISQVCDLLVLHAFVGEKELEGELKLVDEALAGKLSKYMKEDSFKAKAGSSFHLRTQGEITPKHILVLGLGKKENFDIEAIRQASAVSLNMAGGIKAKTIVSTIHGNGVGELNVADCAQAMVEGARLAGYRFETYRKPSKTDVQVKKFDLFVTNAKDARLAEKGIDSGNLFAKGTLFARDLVNTPAQDMYPEKLVEAAKEIAKGKGTIRVRVYDREALKRMGAGGILGVAQGSDHPPYMVHMIYKPKKATKKRVALVGKAVTFDSGGLSLKPAEYMMTMKVDMGGSAAVLGAFSVIDEVAPACEVHGIFAAVENMPSGKAMRPGDVLTAMNKKTIEVLNTDAEGRLTLADTLCFAVKQKPQAIIDLATLTGACVVALGEEYTGVMSNNDVLTQKILEAAETAGEKMWRLPLEKNYRKLLKSQVADMQNIGSRWGGALTAGLFLEEFVNKTPWAHLDIAGPAYAERDIDAYTKKGATGHGVRTLLTYLKNV
ncbi:leucyl aminopeptidase [Candidatus Uhrbacteria bacterium]|nr:leucyl aminopeptidase [Candidatus Uhrbacteria bacterium]